ncbi:unnamed protein product [Zymoseptoria tritici ST99CH_1A5]|uniref:DASH complex subunit SPC34 n=3 Tax=Zymoseptoria tritici TaxID=1047171 RepID=A0A1X7RW58_ZYMT9|nr:unnamed protein product [Zymoseptoria tritici ST99CH_3D7]SMR53872.1 unnamed protein product [Zymoseptoria tritici ST99CH_1E4]SMR56117.1 unnamed protein product [Zymoseptoria tritici ST99CH_3D1]SMY25302.1 unnamed protein product [Zymoseptoria tritici ST99CH_1A5]
MASLLTSHLEQISLCASSIAELPFPGPKKFANALLSQHDITSLIRDTESHERALFHLAPPPLPTKPGAGNDYSSGPVTAPTPAPNRRATMYGGRQTPRNKAVAAVLGGDLYQRTRKEGTRQKGEVDVEVLLEGAERLLAVYSIPGASDRIAGLRRRHQQLTANIQYHEARVNQQSEDLAKISRKDYDAEEDEDGGEDGSVAAAPAVMSREDMEREEVEIRELERKKKALEERVTGMEKDLGGLMR